MMKKSFVLWSRIIFLFLFILAANLVFSQSLKNISIGEKYTGPKDIETTVEYYNGTLTIDRLNDGTVYSFHFISKNVINSRSEMPLFISEADNFLDDVNRDFDITLDRKYWNHREFTEGNLYDVATCSKDGVAFLVSFSVNMYENSSSILFTITSEKLSSKGATKNLIHNRDGF